ncbi:transaldolase [Apiospora arundinis]|uniref:UDP-N-acetylglucosamine transferase subunit ALG14 n=1 Tax=Apiospora arundinis TaxID=335852 RepID=A0ABR2IEU8_9PEZI
MAIIAYSTTNRLNLKARKHVSRGCLGPRVSLTSAAVWFLLHGVFIHASVQGHSVIRKMVPLCLQFIVMAVYFFTLRHKFIILCCSKGAQLPGDFRIYVAGSGGHTGELLQMLTQDPPSDNIHRTWVICHGDNNSRQKIDAWETKRKSGNSLVRGYSIVEIRRARTVLQPWATVPFSAIQCAYDIYQVLNQGYPHWQGQGSQGGPLGELLPGIGHPQVIITNGPGTGFIIAAVAWIMKVLWRLPVSSCKVIFIESIARVKTLSMTGKLFYYTGIATGMIVQHKPVGERYGLKVENMLTARVLDDTDGDPF